MKFSMTAMAFTLALMLVGCAPEVGSERWCNKIKDTDKGEITAQQAADFAKHCIFK